VNGFYSFSKSSENWSTRVGTPRFFPKKYPPGRFPYLSHSSMSPPDPDRARRRARVLSGQVVSCSGEDHADHAVAATESPLAWTRRAGDVFGPGDWFLVEQPLVDAFAQCTRDDQWIHRAGADTPFGGPIAHGFLTLSLLPVLCKHVMPTHAWATSEINCGFNKMRFLSPVKVGARVRATVLVTAAELLDSKNPSAGTQTTSKVTIVIEGTTKPALVAEWVTRQYG
jgi:acyl dehydratase